MNLASNPSREELAKLLSVCDDEAAHHVLWVGHGGEVHITPLPRDASPGSFAERNEAAIKFSVECYARGNGYVGKLAAADRVWVNFLTTMLVVSGKRTARATANVTGKLAVHASRGRNATATRDYAGRFRLKLIETLRSRRRRRRTRGLAPRALYGNSGNILKRFAHPHGFELGASNDYWLAAER